MRFVSAPWALVTLALLAAGCGGSKPSRLYLLEADSAPVVPDRALKTIGVRTVVIPSYLQRPQIVTRSEAGRLEVGEFDRWAEPLEDALRGALVENLRRELPGVRVITASGTESVDLLLRVRVEHFELTAEGSVRLSGTWWGETPGDSGGGAANGFDIRRDFAGSDKRNAAFYADLVLVMSEMVADLAVELGSASRQ